MTLDEDILEATSYAVQSGTVYLPPDVRNPFSGPLGRS